MISRLGSFKKQEAQKHTCKLEQNMK